MVKVGEESGKGLCVSVGGRILVKWKPSKNGEGVCVCRMDVVQKGKSNLLHTSG